MFKWFWTIFSLDAPELILPNFSSAPWISNEGFSSLAEIGRDSDV